MPSMLKSLFKSAIPSRPKKPNQHPQPLSPGAFPNYANRSSTYSTDELTQLTADLARALNTNPAPASKIDKKSRSGKSKSKSKSKDKSRGAFQDKLHTAVQAIENGNINNSQISPYYLTPASQSSSNPGNPGLGHSSQTNPYYSGNDFQPSSNPVDPGPSYVPPKYTTTQPSAGDEWSLAFQCCSAALASAEHIASLTTLAAESKRSANRCVSLIDAQRDELFVMRPWAEDKQLPTFRTLTQVYTEIINALDEVQSQIGNETAGLRTVFQVLQEGPDYLIDIGLVECIIWQAEVIDPGFGADIRNLLHEAVVAQVDFSEFRRRLEDMIEVALNPPPDAVDDDLGRDALDAIRSLVKQLKSRIGSHSVPLILPNPPSPAISSASSISSASFGAPSPTRPTHTSYNAQTLQTAYGTGPLPSPAPSPMVSRAPSPAPSTISTSSSQKSIFEYRGHRLTRSALELVQTQERLAMADSSGQYAGEVSWDDLRNCWIPKWAEKLKEEDVAEGEIGDNNPNGYKVKKKDAWGNRIGWYEGRMYYEEEPSFDLRS